MTELLQETDEEEDVSARGADTKVGRHEALTGNTCCTTSLSFSSFLIITLHVSEVLCKSTVGADYLVHCLFYQHKTINLLMNVIMSDTWPYVVIYRGV